MTLTRDGQWHVLYRSGMDPEVAAMRHENSFPVLTRPGFCAPNVILASVTLADVGLLARFVVRVTSGGTVRVTQLTVQPIAMVGADAAVTSRALRSIRLDYLAREAMRKLEFSVSMAEDYTEGAFRITGDTEGVWGSHGSVIDVQNHQELLWVSRPVPGRRLTSREQAEQAARLYAKAVASGSKAPTQAVANGLGYSRSQASRMIRTARDLGLLSETVATTPIETTSIEPVQSDKPEAGPSIFRDPNGPRPWEDNEGKRTDASDQDD